MTGNGYNYLYEKVLNSHPQLLDNLIVHSTRNNCDHSLIVTQTLQRVSWKMLTDFS